MDPRSVSRPSSSTSAAGRTEVGCQEDFAWPPPAEDLAAFSLVGVDGEDPRDEARLIVAGMRGTALPPAVEPRQPIIPRAPAPAPAAMRGAAPAPGHATPLPPPRPPAAARRITVTRPEPRPVPTFGPLISAALAFVFVSCMALISYTQVKTAQRQAPAAAIPAAAPAAIPAVADGAATPFEPPRVPRARTAAAPAHGG